MSLWLNVFILFVILWLIEGYLKKINDNLSYLIELLEQNYKLDDNEQAEQADQTNEQVNQTREQVNQIRSRKDLYK
ncbi:hypothetical protein [Limosilactobacillus fermentum]|uniref:hypothetical protein n=1 Tax=Limosilactobacillus fermentum TaxID=1613 RepID=UPI0021BF3B3A|nr:hypothetical protein [Limosilactobacillus fermentum]